MENMTSIQKKQKLIGKYLNIGNAGFRSIKNSEYVDKSGLIDFRGIYNFSWHFSSLLFYF